MGWKIVDRFDNNNIKNDKMGLEEVSKFLTFPNSLWTIRKQKNGFGDLKGFNLNKPLTNSLEQHSKWWTNRVKSTINIQWVFRNQHIFHPTQ